MRAASLGIKKRYFLDEEFQETLSKKIYSEQAPIIKREHIYESTGAKYLGEWKGGFRHGYGIMQWQDGAKYEGYWCLGRAYGQGIFTHSKGEVYSGEWRNDKAHGQGTYTHSNGA